MRAAAIALLIRIVGDSDPQLPPQAAFPACQCELKQCDADQTDGGRDGDALLHNYVHD